MFGNSVILIVIVASAVALGWLAFRARRATNKVVKWGGTIGSGLFAVVLTLVSVFMLVGMVKAYSPRSAPIPAVQVAGTPEQIARGQHIANSFCASCHSTTNELPLTGGLDLGKDFPMPLGTFVSANLTPAGPLKDWSDGEIFRAIRNGIDRDGNVLFAMSGARGRNLSDADIEAVIAYLRSQPAVVNDTPMPLDQYSPLALILVGAGVIPEGEPPITQAIAMPAKSANGGVWRIHLELSGLRALPRRRFDGRRAGTISASGAEPGRRQRLDAGTVHRHAAHRRRSERSRAE